jgi:ferredoxin
MSSPGDETWSGMRGRIDARLLTSAVEDFTSCRAHICGPPSMMDAVKAALLELGVSETQVRTEAFGTITRHPGAKSAHSSQIAGKIMFHASDTSAPAPADTTILDVADEAGVFIDNACRSGTCASCRVKLLSGNVKMAVEDALTEQDKAEGYILACQAKIGGDVTVDA